MSRRERQATFPSREDLAELDASSSRALEKRYETFIHAGTHHLRGCYHLVGKKSTTESSRTLAELLVGQVDTSCRIAITGDGRILLAFEQLTEILEGELLDRDSIRRAAAALRDLVQGHPQLEVYRTRAEERLRRAQEQAQAWEESGAGGELLDLWATLVLHEGREEGRTSRLGVDVLLDLSRGLELRPETREALEWAAWGMERHPKASRAQRGRFRELHQQRDRNAPKHVIRASSHLLTRVGSGGNPYVRAALAGHLVREDGRTMVLTENLAPLVWRLADSIPRAEVLALESGCTEAELETTLALVEDGMDLREAYEAAQRLNR